MPSSLGILLVGLLAECGILCLSLAPCIVILLPSQTFLSLELLAHLLPLLLKIATVYLSHRC